MNKWWKIGCGVLAALIVLTAAVVIFTQQRQQQAPKTPETFNPELPLQVELITPHDDEQWPINTFVPVRGFVKSENRVMAVELWIDGKFYGARTGLDEHSFTTATGEWYWQPATLGPHTLMLRGADEGDRTGFSSLIRIQAVKAVSSRGLVIPEDGQNLAQIANTSGLSLEALEQSNPGVDPGEGLTPNDSIFLPGIIDPVIDVQTPSQEPYQPETPSSDSKDTLPAAPTLLTAELRNGCDAYLEFKDNAGNETGNRIYRSMPGQSDFSLIAKLPASSGKPLKYTETGINIKGGWTYVAAAYNDVGEAKSLPVTINLANPDCYPPEPQPGEGSEGELIPGQFSEDLVIISPEPLSLAYIYITINGSTSRIPKLSNTFFEEGAVTSFDLTEYMMGIIEELPDATQYIIHVELWAWKGGKPELIEEYDKIITDFTRLLACLETAPGVCDNPGAQWSTQVLIPADMAPKDVNLRFKILTLKKTSGVYWDLTSASQYNELFKVDYFENLEAPPTSGATPAYFSDSWASLYDSSNKNYSTEPDVDDSLPWIKTGFWMSHTQAKPFMVYYRVRPNYRDPATDIYDYSEFSNRVYIFNEGGQPAPKEEIPIAPTLPDLYWVEFLEETYKLPEFAIPARYGCIRYLDNGQEQCPQPYADPCADQWSWSCFSYVGQASLNQFIDYWDWFAAHYNEVTTVVSDALIDFIPDCELYDACKWIAREVVELAWSYITSELGLPSKMPTTSEFGETELKAIMRYYVSSAYTSVLEDSQVLTYLQKLGVDEKLNKIISNYVSEKADEYREKLVDDLYAQFINSLKGPKGPLCGADESAAHAKGYEPFCPDPNRPALPAAGAQCVGPTIMVRITRKTPEENTNYGTDATIANYQTAELYALKLTNAATNDHRIGQVIPLFAGYNENYTKDSCNNSGCTLYPPKAPVCYFGYGGTEGARCWFEVTDPLKGPLYDEVEMPVPWLDIGKSVEVPVYFPEVDYWFPEKLNAIQWFNFTTPADWKAIYGDDWMYLYFFGQQTFKAEIDCQSNVPEKVFCGSSDEYTPPIPQP